MAVSISAGVLAIGSAFDFNDKAGIRVGLALVFLALLTVGNLRGLKESGRVFAVPTYFYVAMLLTLLAAGLYQVYFGTVTVIDTPESRAAVAGFAEENELASTAALFIILKAFSLRRGGALRRGGHLQRRPRLPQARRRGTPPRRWS